jgi:hypothetical protein
MSDVRKSDLKYSAPKLIRYGDMAQLTAGGMGSMAESGTKASNKHP